MVNLNKFKELGFDSIEEYMIQLYFEELQEQGFVKEIISQPEPFVLFKGLGKKFYKNKQLKTKIKTMYSKKKFLINPHEYTTDFKIEWNLDKSPTIFEMLISDEEFDITIPFRSAFYKKESIETVSYLEVKPSFDQNNMTRLFTSRTQPWIWEKYNIYVQLIKPLDLFKATFIPELLMPFMYYRKTTKKNNIGDKKHKWEYKTLTEFLNK